MTALESYGGRVLFNVILQWQYVMRRDADLAQSAAYIAGMIDMAHDHATVELFDELTLLRRILIMWEGEAMRP